MILSEKNLVFYFFLNNFVTLAYPTYTSRVFNSSKSYIFIIVDKESILSNFFLFFIFCFCKNRRYNHIPVVGLHLIFDNISGYYLPRKRLFSCMCASHRMLWSLNYFLWVFLKLVHIHIRNSKETSNTVKIFELFGICGTKNQHAIKLL